MTFELLKEEEFAKFLSSHPLKNFMQTPEIGALRKKSGWSLYYVGVKDQGKIIAATMLLSHLRRFSVYEFYAPRGLLVDYEDEETLSFFVSNLKNFIKEKKGYILRIDPYYIKKERDINGDVVEGGIDHTKALSNLYSLGFKKSAKNEQISWSFSLDLDRELGDILKDMRSFTRRSIKKAEKNHIVIRDAEYEELSLVKEILDATCNRKHFANRNLEYFQNLYELLGKKGNARFILADIHLKELLEELTKTVENEKSMISKMEKEGSREAKIASHRTTLAQAEEKMSEVSSLKEKYGDVVSVSSGVFITYGDEVLYLFGGNREEFMHFGCPHFVQWEMIRYAKENGFHRYNFYGISGNFDKEDPSYGIYDFKKGFTGYVEELIGEHELCIMPIYCFLFKILHAIKK